MPPVDEDVPAQPRHNALSGGARYGKAVQAKSYIGTVRSVLWSPSEGVRRTVGTRPVEIGRPAAPRGVPLWCHRSRGNGSRRCHSCACTQAHATARRARVSWSRRCGRLDVAEDSRPALVLSQPPAVLNGHASHQRSHQQRESSCCAEKQCNRARHRRKNNQTRRSSDAPVSHGKT